jgi:hypothetical protein
VPARLLALVLVAGFLLAASPPKPQTLVSRTPLVGFSYSPKIAADLGLEPVGALFSLLHRLHPDLVRLPVYWDAVAPDPQSFDFSSVDSLLGTVAAYNRTSGRHPARVMLVAGARNLRFPEVHIPSWAPEITDLSRLSGSATYQHYLEETFERYAKSPLLYAWQIENEPLDRVKTDWDGQVTIPSSVIASELGLLRAIDTSHRVVVTTFNSSTLDLDQRKSSPLSALLARLPVPQPTGHPSEALQLADALGLDLYVVTASTSLTDASAATRIGWKQETLGYWATRALDAGKELWITEMQGEPWPDQDGFTTEDLLASAAAYKDQGARVVLLWGVESWLLSADWMAAGMKAVSTLRVGPGGFEPYSHHVPGAKSGFLR